MSAPPFVHLQVASGFSMRHGAASPGALVQRAGELGMDLLALTDRDGLYGAVRFAKACMAAGISPLLGVDLAIAAPEESSSGAPVRRRTPIRGGAVVDPRHPRVVVLARGGAQGWAALCRLVTDTHLAGQRGTPVSSIDLVAEHARGGHLVVILGTDSEVGRAIASRRPDLAVAVVRRWRQAAGEHSVVIGVTSHLAPGSGPAPFTTAHAARMLRLAHEQAIPAVLTHGVRCLDRRDGPVLDVLDASRRLVALDARHLDRVNAEGYLADSAVMAGIADEIERASGLSAQRLLRDTRELAERCALDARVDLGFGDIHLPEFDVILPPELLKDASATEALRRAEAVLLHRCESGLMRRYGTISSDARRRLDDEFDVVRQLAFASYFLTVADVCDLIRSMGVRVAARGSGAGSLICYALDISGVDPLRHGLLMERFLSPLRRSLPDIDVDVESARRAEVYERILDVYGAERVACVSMMDTYRIRHAVRDVGAALGMPPGEVDAIAKAFPHIRARDIRPAMAELPELRASGVVPERLEVLIALVERLDGLPRHIALHPCGVLLSDATLLDRTPVEASFLGYPMSQFDKDDVEDLGLLKLDVLGIRMQSAMQHAVAEVQRVDGVQVDLDDRSCVPLDDPETFALIQSTRTLGCFQIESPGQRELVGKFAPETFDDLVIDISLFRPGPVKSDMITPFLEARHGWKAPEYLHPDLEPYLRGTAGVVVFHEQVLQIVSTFTGCSLAEADEVRRALGDLDGRARIEQMFFTRGRRRGYDEASLAAVWAVLEAFASFGFCKAHAAAFALPTYQSAWLKTHHTAAFVAGVLTHDPGMYPKRLILDDARNFGVAVLGLDVNSSERTYRVERLSEDPEIHDYGIRLALSEVSGISEAEVNRIVAGRPYATLSDFWHRAHISRPVAEKLVLTGAFDAMYGIGSPRPASQRITRRDLLLQVGDLERWSRPRTVRRRGGTPAVRSSPTTVRERTAAQAQGLAPDWNPAHVPEANLAVQLALDVGDAPQGEGGSGLPELTEVERVRAELEILGMDASRHVLDFYAPFLLDLQVTRSRDLRSQRHRSELLVAGVKVATQTPPIRSGRRVVFLTLDDTTGPVDATFFEDVQGPYAATVFHSWLLIVRGILRRTGPRGVSLRATGAWELTAMHERWRHSGRSAVLSLMADAETAQTSSAQQRRVLVHPTGALLSPYADIRPAGADTSAAPRKLWHASPGSAGA